MPKKHEPDARFNEIRTALIKQITELWDKHEGEPEGEGFTAILEDSESKKIKLNFAATLDFSESKAALETTLSYSQVVKDKRRDEFDDPNQPTLPLNGAGEVDAFRARNGDDGITVMDPDAEPSLGKTGKRRGKAAAVAVEAE